MSTQNILYSKDVLDRYEKKLISLGEKFLLKSKFEVGEINLNKVELSLRLRDLICDVECTRVPLERNAKEYLNKLIIKL